MLRISNLSASTVVALSVLGMSEKSLGAPKVQPSLIVQAEGLPGEFQEHFFDVPLAVRVKLDREVLGEAMVVLSRDERVSLVEFSDTRDSNIDAAERAKWQAILQQGLALGPCTSQCNEGLIAAHYSLENSEQALLTSNAERDVTASTHYTPPEGGSTGLMLTNQLNLSGGQKQDLTGRYALQATGSLGTWTQTFHGQLTRDGGPDDTLRHSVYELHTQKEWQDNFLRLGYFTPVTVGLSRVPRTFGNSPDITLGVMLGSSDSLVKNGSKAAIYPIYVTASREGTVEVYRDGALINSQPIQPGLQILDTRPLPGGIYDVEVRLIEDGSITSRSNELVYKPGNWRNPEQRWRYNVFAGRESALLSNWDTPVDGEATAGAAINYLLHPRAIVGLSGRHIKGHSQLGTSLDLGLGQRSSVYASLYQAQERGFGADLQALYNYGGGNVMFSHNRSWLDNRDTWETLGDGTRVRQRNPYNGNTRQSSVSVNHRLGGHDSLSARVSHSEGYLAGMGLDLGWMRSSNLFGYDAHWRLSVFDRPGSSSTGHERNRGVDLSLNLALGGEGKSITASVGSRASRNGDNDRNASLGYQQDLTFGPLRSVNAAVQADTYGTGLSGGARLDSDIVSGDLQLQRSSYNQSLSGSLNLNSNLALGDQKLAVSGQHLGDQASMIVDVESDVEAIELRADDLSGSSAILKPGRNLLALTAYRDGTVQFDFPGVNAPAATIQPARARYHLNRGGVTYQRVRVMKTLTLFGRLLDAQGQPLKGHHVLNHASRGVTEVDGFFSMELSASEPTLEVVRGDKVICQFALNLETLPKEDDILMAGDLRCNEGPRVKLAQN